VARLLLVDDEPDFREIVRTFLERRGHEVVELADGNGVATILEADTEIDAVLTDQHMPLVSGVEVRERLATTHPHLPVRIWSGLPDPRRDIVPKSLRHLDEVLAGLLPIERSPS
jgi:CheY-like chemotaxis protein